MTDFPDWQQPQATAQQIAATGVPLLTASAVLNKSVQVIPASGSVSLGPFSISQIGYELNVATFINNSATNPFITVILTWVDVTSGQEVSTDSFTTVCGDASLAAFPTTARGPSKADQVSVTIRNNDTGFAATVDVIFLQNSRIYPRDDVFWVSQYPNTLLVPVFTLALQPPDETVLGIISGTAIAGSSSITRLAGIGQGPVGVGINMNTGALSALSLFIAPEPNSLYGGNNPVFGGVPPAAAFQVACPRAPVRLVLTNLTTTSITVTMSLIRAV